MPIIYMNKAEKKYGLLQLASMKWPHFNSCGLDLHDSQYELPIGADACPLRINEVKTQGRTDSCRFLSLRNECLITGSFATAQALNKT